MIKWGVIGVLCLFSASYFMAALGYRQDCVVFEKGIPAQYSQNKNNYDNMWKKFKEIAQVPSMYTDDMKKLWELAIQGRYGPDGSKALFQFIKEHNPNVPPSMYTKMQSIIEAGRNSFSADQQQLIDKKRQYGVLLDGNRALFVGFWFDFPRIDLDAFDIITSEETEGAFSTKKSEPIQLR